MSNRIITPDHVLSFQLFLQEEERRALTVEKYMRDVRHFLTFLAGQPLQKTRLIDYKAYLEQHYTIRSANSMLAAVNALLRYLGWHDLCLRAFRIQRDAYCSQDQELTRAEYTALVTTARQQGNERIALILQTLCSTGIRVSELTAITVEAIQQGEAVVSCKGKTRKIFLVPALRKKLLAYVRRRGILSGQVFITRNGKPLNRSNIWREMKQLCRAAGVSPNKVFPHNLRHLFARTFYGIEKDIAKLADILGHSNINTTRLYIITTGVEHRRRMENLHLIV